MPRRDPEFLLGFTRGSGLRFPAGHADDPSSIPRLASPEIRPSHLDYRPRILPEYETRSYPGPGRNSKRKEGVSWRMDGIVLAEHALSTFTIAQQRGRSLESEEANEKFRSNGSVRSRVAG
ncbi:hypothetical protein KM043_000731 [Ampulex compressa]|nr:hypothetical protein KM043_000731 [Ampulex compressa]